MPRSTSLRWDRVYMLYSMEEEIFRRGSYHPNECIAESAEEVTSFLGRLWTLLLHFFTATVAKSG